MKASAALSRRITATAASARAKAIAREPALRPSTTKPSSAGARIASAIRPGTNGNENAAVLGDAQIEAIAELFSVLAEPTRLRILRFLHDGPATVNRIVDAVGIKQANASKQLAILHRAGVVTRSKSGVQVRYEIGMPIVFDLCTLVCGGVQQQAQSRADALRAK